LADSGRDAWQPLQSKILRLIALSDRQNNLGSPRSPFGTIRLDGVRLVQS